jgi:hypothetical protein
MKKLFCMVLIVWLPLFMGSAWAMSMHMTLENQQAQSAQANTKSHMSCHESKNKTQQNQSTKSHQCSVCGMCALVNGTASFNTAPILNLATSQFPTPQYFYAAFTSQDLLPSYKPPILI